MSKKKEETKITNDPRLFKERKEIIWSSQPLPMLTLPPEDTGYNPKGTMKVNLNNARKKPFCFDLSDFQEPEKPQEPDPRDDFENIPEPKTGIYDRDFDEKAYEATKAKIPYIKFIPYTLSRQEPPLRSPEQFKETEKLLDLNLLKRVDPNSISYIRICDVQIPSKHLKNLAKQLVNFPRLECLILRNVGLKSISDFKSLPKLKYCDFSKNKISDLKACMKLFSRTPYIELINLAENPVVNKPNFREKIIATNGSLFLRSLNGTDITIEERINALVNFGTKQIREDLPSIRWDLYLASVPEIKDTTFYQIIQFYITYFFFLSMRRWQPELITKIEFKNVGLSLIHVGELKSLVHLDLSNNKISALRGSGLEHLNKLQYLDLSNNLLFKKEDLRAFYYIPSLKTLKLEGNKDLGHYRSLVIAITKDLIGDNRALGLLSLDGKIITVEERIRSIMAFNKKANENALRWKYDLITYYGHYQIRLPNFLSKVRHLRLRGKNLNVVNISNFHSLEVLDLSKNNLRTVDGLEKLTRIRYLNLYNNPKLSLKETLPKLAKINSLEQIFFGTDDPNHKRFIKNPKYRIRVLKEVLFTNPNLVLFDGELISLAERVETYRALGGTNEQVETYRFHLALNNNCTLPWNRRFHFTEVEIGNQYDPVAITVLRRMHNSGLLSQFCNFKKFVNLEELNLSGNRLSAINGMGLEELPNLRILDVSNNQIETSLKDLAAYIDRLKSLEILSIHTNPVMKSFADRMNLIGFMKNMREVTCVLKVIDTEITLDERVEAWKRVGGLNEEVELMRYKAIMFQRLPSDIPPFQVKSLDLINGGLEQLELAKFENLEVLLLKGNRIKTIEAIGGLSRLTKLKVLDLRKNNLSKLEEIVKLINDTPSLISIGLKGNPFTKNKDWRLKLIGSLPQLHDQPTKFRLIDNQPITFLEVVKTWKVGSDTSPDRIRFQVCRIMQIPENVPPEKVIELNLSECEFSGLADVDLGEFTALQRLSLKNNQLKTVQDCNLEKLTNLTELDISGNKLKELQPLIELLNKLPKIKMFWVDNNPCWKDYDPKLRVKFLGSLACMDNLDASLKFLNGFQIEIPERCNGLLENGIYNAEGLERFRIDLIWEKLNPQTTQETLNLSGFQIKSLKDLPSKLAKLSNVQHLDLSNNEITSLDELSRVLQDCFKLTSLDIRDNKISADLADLISVLRMNCPMLKKLWIARSTKGKDTQKPKEYLNQVFSQMLELDLLDNFPHPGHFDQGPRKIKTVFSVFDASNVPNNKSHSEEPSEDNSEENFLLSPFPSANPPLSEDQYRYSGNFDGFANAPTFDDYGTTTNNYPELSGFSFSPESYLPTDYHNTFGKSYDLAKLAKEAAEIVNKQEDSEEEEDD